MQVTDRINRYIMECKLSKFFSCPVKPHLELIDTLWNVNCSLLSRTEIRHIELIDTLWNVNIL